MKISVAHARGAKGNWYQLDPGREHTLFINQPKNN